MNIRKLFQTISIKKTVYIITSKSLLQTYGLASERRKL